MGTHMHNPESFETINEFRKGLIDEICKETDPAPVCERADVDVAFLIDSSGSIHSQDYELMKKWLVDFTKNFAIGDYNAKFAIVQYAKKIESVFTFNHNTTDLDKAVTNMQQIRGQTFTGQALEYAKDNVFTLEAGSRPDVAKVIILITDGKATDDPLEIAKLIHDWKVLVYTVGVGQADQQELLQIASEKDNHYDVKNYNSISDIKKSLLGKVQVGLVQYATTPQTEIELGEFTNKEDLMEAI